MENKPANIFDKLDEQGKKIDDVSEKLEGVNINDLYALARRSWKIKDYINAQKYFSNISLLRPLDWEAPLYATLCGFHGSFVFDEMELLIEKAKQATIATFEYINDLTLGCETKEEEFARCAQIIEEEVINQRIKNYRSNKEFYNQNGKKLVIEIENMMTDVFINASKIDSQSVKQFCEFIANCLSDFILETKVLTQSINETLFDQINKITNYKIDKNTISEIKAMEKEEGDTANLTQEEINTIKLKGKWFFEYDDAFEARRVFKKRLFTGLFIASTSLLCLVVSVLYNIFWLTPIILIFLCSLPLIWLAFTERRHICVTSLFSSIRLKRRLTSNNDVDISRVPYLTVTVLYQIGCIFILSINVFFGIFILVVSEHRLLMDFIVAAIVAIDSIIIFVICLNLSPATGYFRCYYKEKSYHFDVY